jgi:hypothetical protein
MEDIDKIIASSLVIQSALAVNMLVFLPKKSPIQQWIGDLRKYKISIISL